MQISGMTMGGTLAGVLADAQTVRQRLDVLTRQASDGLVADQYSGLGAQASRSLSLSPAIATAQTWQANIAAAAGPMQTAQGALTQIADIAQSLYARTNGLNSLSPQAVDAAAGAARDALRQVAGLLDSKFGDSFVFSGIHSQVEPVPSPDNILNSGMVTGIAAAVAGLGANGAAATIASTLALAGSNAPGISPFASQLSAPAASLQPFRPLVQTGPDQFVPTGVLASSNADVTSAGTSTTGSYIRDIMRALATVGSLSGTQAGVAGFDALVLDVHGSLGDAISALSAEQGVLGDRQTALQARSSQLDDVGTALKGQVSDAQDVDMAETLSRLSQTQTQLQASYQLIATLRGLSLANVLGGG